MKQGQFSKNIVKVSYISIILFTITCLVYQFVARQEVSDVLIGGFFGFCGTELLAIAGIKHSKIKNGGTIANIVDDVTCANDTTTTDDTTSTEGEG